MRYKKDSDSMISYEVKLVISEYAVDTFLFKIFIMLEQPSEWRPLLDTLKDLQAFSNFLDDRIALNKLDRGNFIFA